MCGDFCYVAAPQAQKCFEQARSIEPTLVAVWEAMGAAASSNSNTEAAARDMLDNYEHAVGLGGGLESWLGYATGAMSILLLLGNLVVLSSRRG